MGTNTTKRGYYKPAHNETGWDSTFNTQTLDAIDADVGGIIDGSQMAQVATKAPTELTSSAVLTVPTTAGGVLLSTISGGIPSGATHAIITNLHATNTIYYTLDGSTAPVATVGSEVGIPLTSQDVAEVQNLASVKLIATASSRLYVAFRKYV